MLNRIVAVALITMANAAAAKEFTCTVTFDGEEPVVMQSGGRPGAKILVADSATWPKPRGARIEVNVMVADERNHVPLTAYLQERRIETGSGGGNELNFPVVRPARRVYWFNPHEGLQVIGPTGSPVAFVKCLK